jgi:hypothetical protein
MPTTTSISLRAFVGESLPPAAAKINSERIGDVLAMRRFVKNQKLLLVQGLQEPDFLNLELLLRLDLTVFY